MRSRSPPSPGKIVGSTLYVHRDAIPRLTPDEKARIERAQAVVGEDAPWNVAKLDDRQPDRVSLLCYEGFLEVAFPALRTSFAVDLAAGRVSRRVFDRDNPPILHRKELLLAADHPARPRYAALTRALEARGLLTAMRGMGRARPWAARLAAAGVAVDDHELREPAPPAPAADRPSTVAVARHKTAIPRDRLSAPMAALHRHGLIDADSTVLDYGCGRGDDVRTLREAGINAVGWDPHHAPDAERRPSAVVNLGFVLNVIEAPEERRAVLRAAFARASSCLAVAVMVVGKADVSGLTPYRDGFLTRRRTFQKYFEQAELRALIAATLDVEPVAVAPGLFFVFKDEIREQRFLLGRQRRAPPPALPEPRLRPPSRPRHRPDVEERLAELVAAYVDTMLALGRRPDADELPADLRERIDCTPAVSLRRLAQRAPDQIDRDTLERARTARRDDLRVYFALNTFNGRQRYGALPPELQRDVRAFFGSHQDAVAAGGELLFAIADVAQLTADAAHAFDRGVGWLEAGDLLVHRDHLQAVSPLLRTYVGVGQRLAGSLDEAQIFKIHLRSGKLTALDYAGFDDHPLPRLRTRTKIDLRRQRVELFDYGREGTVQLLYLKSRLLPLDHPDLARQRQFDAALRATGLFDFTGHGPSFDDFARKLKRHGLRIDGHHLHRGDPLAANPPAAPTPGSSPRHQHGR